MTLNNFFAEPIIFKVLNWQNTNEIIVCAHIVMTRLFMVNKVMFSTELLLSDYFYLFY